MINTKIKLFQVCNTKEELKNVETNFVAFDNTSSIHKDLKEFHIFDRLITDGHTKDVGYWGIFDTVYKTRLRFDSNEIIKTINENPNKDIYLFNFAKIHDALTVNVWEQGDNYFPGIKRVAEYSLDKMGYDPKVVNLMTTDANTCYNNYFVASSKFWKRYMVFLNSLKSELDDLPSDMDRIYKTNYTADLNATLFPFIVERMLTTFLLIDKTWNVYAKPYDYEIYRPQINDSVNLLKSVNEIKKLVVKLNSNELLEQWNTLRMFIVKVSPRIFDID